MIAFRATPQPGQRSGSSRPTVGIVCDMLEEGWRSMDLVADRLVGELEAHHADAVKILTFRPSLRRRFSRVVARAGKAFALDRLVGRFVDYPRVLRAARGTCDLFHI